MPNTNKKLDSIRHSLAHLLAAAVLKHWPDAKLGIGPTIEHGFYYDILFPEGENVSSDDFKKLESDMKKMIKDELPFSGKEVSVKEAKKLFKDQPFKVDLINEFSDEGKDLTVYETGDIFLDLCRGGHVETTGEINPNAFTLTKIAGAYWRGDENNQMLTRIYGAAFETQKELDEYLKNVEEAKKRDHKKVGKQLGLFVFSNPVGPGLPLFTPKGKTILDEIKNFSREIRKETGYKEVQTPQINKDELFKTSGHYDKFRDDMFKVKSNYSDTEYFMKPMNCPQHTQIYASEMRSYRDLPIKYADFAMLYRDEKPGELSGLTRLRSFSQDDAHCFCREDQIADEFEKALKGVSKALETYKIDYFVRLSFRDKEKTDDYLGTDELWNKSETILENLVKEQDIDYEIEEGEAAFYGPKMDFVVKDALSREWQVSTIQLDINMPARFELEYVNEEGEKETPVMIHSALVGSPERFFGILIEHYGGAFPTWLAPVQVEILPISEDQLEYGEEIKSKLEKENVRVEIPDVDETLGKRIRNFEKQKAAYALIVGDNEKEAGTVSIRSRDEGEMGEKKIKEFIQHIKTEIDSRQ